MLERIDNPHDPRLAPFAGMHDVELRARTGLFIGESDKVISRALDAGVVPQCLFMDERWEEKTAPITERILDARPDVPVLVANRETFRAVTGYEVTRGAVAALRRPAPRAAAELLAGARRVLVLEDVMNATNIGAIFRSAAALGIDAVLLSPACHDPLFRRAARVSMGTVFQVPWARIGAAGAGGAWAHEGLALLHAHGFTVAAMALTSDAVALDDARLRDAGRLALVMGTEGDGLTAPVLQGADLTVRIPMAAAVDSLNVAVAAGIACWELTR